MSKNDQDIDRIPPKPNPKVYWFVLRTLTIAIVVFCFWVVGYVVVHADPTASNVIHENALRYAFVIIGLIPIAYTSISSVHESVSEWIANKFKK